MSLASPRTKNTFYSARYHRLAGRRGKKRAALAVARSILTAVYFIVRDGVPYKELGADYLNSRMETKRKKYLQAELKKMGYEVQLLPAKPVNPTGD